MKPQLRQATPSDLNFIYNSWLKSYRNSPWAANVPSAVYFKIHHDLIEALIQRSSCVVACDSEDPDQILGFAIVEQRRDLKIAHYVYVKQPYRRIGVATTLLGVFGDIDFSSHFTRSADKLARNVGAVFNPYLATK